MLPIIGRYELLTEIASGGMASVYAARVKGAEGFEKLVALKRMLPAISSDPEFQKMFLDEGRLAAHIRSSYVVSTFDLDRHHDGSFYLVMDLVIGASVSSILRGSGGALLPIPVVVQIVQHAARGLHDAHEARSALGQALQIVHRDISPQNILVGLDGSTRITDFGIAHAKERLTKTVAGSLKGKLAYCSPEQAQGQPVDRRSDIFSLGIVLWEALTQRRLFRRDAASDTLSAVLSAPVPDPRNVRPEISQELAAVVMRALQRDVDHRFQDAQQFADALKSTTPAPRSEEVHAVVHDTAGESIDRLVAAIRSAVRGAGAAPGFAGATLVDAGPPGIERATLATHAMKQIDGGRLRLTAKATRPIRPPDRASVNRSQAMHAVDPALLSASISSGPSSPRLNSEPAPASVSVEPPSKVGRASPKPTRVRRLVLYAGLAGLLLGAMLVGHLLATDNTDAENEHALAPQPPNNTLDPISEVPWPGLGDDKPPDVLNPADVPAVEVTAAGDSLSGQIADATRQIEELDNAPTTPRRNPPESRTSLRTRIAMDTSAMTASPLASGGAETRERESRVDSSVHLRGVSCDTSAWEYVAPSDVAHLERRLRLVACPPEAHSFTVEYRHGSLSDVRFGNGAPYSECFQAGVRRAAQSVPLGTGTLFCTTGN